ncbi:MAG TPA: LssY C-terminal domain-containing protein [Bryobacteraceae bacterium]|nr:LssY C-terminal domain-containing protein [Bryobacteraceae bacterium]
MSVAAAALQVPAGTGIQIRLKTKVSTQTSKAKDAVEAVVIAPVMVNNQFAIPAGAIVRGTVDKVTQSTKPDERSLLVLKFTEIEISGTKLKLAAQLSGVENARESVDDQGQINGIIAADTISGRLDTQLDKLGEKYASFADILTAAKKAVIQSTESDITYDTGVEMDLKLTAPLALDKPSGPGPAASLQPIPNLDALAAMAAKQPFQTMAESPSKPSDVTNLMVIGSEEQVKQAFSDAGWSSAAALSAESKLQTVQAVAEQRGYKEAPVSVLLLDGKPPDLVFEKLNNTFAMRHHLRVWRQPATFDGKAVWVISATHDTGIDFSAENRTFIHKIDSQIDRERAKVVNDLLFTGKVSGMALVDRPDVPTHSQNATGDDLDTDGKIAVLLLK